MSQPLTKKQQYIRVGYLGVCFMIMFTSFNSLQNMVSKLYEEYDYNNLGQTAIIFLYFTFASATVFTSYIIKHIGYKKTMFGSAIGYAIFEATGLLIVSEMDIDQGFVWVCVILGAALAGFSASVLWVAQGAYTSSVASVDRKNQLFGLFWGLMMSSQILGNTLSTFVLGKINNLVYFIILTILGSLSALLFLFIPNVDAKSESQQVSIKEQVKKVWQIVKNKKYLIYSINSHYYRYKYLNMYFFFPGLTVAFYAGFLYKLVKFSILQKEGEPTDDYNKRVNEHEGYVFITLGFSQLTMGIFMNRFGQRFNKFKMATVGTLLVEVAGFVSFICYYLKSYELCFVAAFLWGSSETFLQTNTGGLISIVFPGKVEGFTVYRMFFAFGVVFTLFISIVLSEVDAYVFLTIVLLLQTLVSALSLNLRYLEPNDIVTFKDNRSSNKDGESLISNSSAMVDQQQQ